MPSRDEALSELATLAAALRAHMEWQEATGCVGLPQASSSDIEERWGALARESQAIAPAHPRQEAASAMRAPHAGLDAPAARPAQEPSDPQEAHSGERPARQSAGSGAPAHPPVLPPEALPAGPAPAHSTPREEPPQAAADGAPAARKLELLADEVRSCQGCGLHATRTQTVFSRGSLSSGLCFIGEAPGEEEDARGEPFVGKAGQLLDKMIAAMGLDRAEVYVCNAIKCRPPNNRKPTDSERAACRSFFERQLEIAAPTVIVALGATAVSALLGDIGGITRVRGSWRLYDGRIPVMPTFHPAYLLRNPAAKREVWQDLQQVLQHMGRTIPGRD